MSGAVDHDFGDVRVLHQVLERSEAERFVNDLLAQARRDLRRIRRTFAARVAVMLSTFARSSASFAASVCARASGDEVELPQQRLMNLLLERVALRVDHVCAGGMAVAAYADVRRSGIRASPVGDAADGCNVVSASSGGKRFNVALQGGDALGSNCVDVDSGISAMIFAPSARSISLRESGSLSPRALLTKAIRLDGMPKRCRSANVACAPATPKSVGSNTTKTRRARVTNGRTAAANGCGASTMIASNPVRSAATASTVFRIER